MVSLADISDLLTKVLGSSIGPIPFFAFPALALGIGVAVWFLKANVKKEVTIDSSKGSSLMTAKAWLKRNVVDGITETKEDQEGKVTLDDGLEIDHSKAMETEAEKRLEALRREIIDDFGKMGLLGRGNGDAKNYLNRVVGYSFALALTNSRPRFDGISFDIVSKEGDLALAMPDGKVGSLVFEPMNQEESLKELETRITRIEAMKQKEAKVPVAKVELSPTFTSIPEIPEEDSETEGQ